MSASITEPILLSSYGLSKHLKQPKDAKELRQSSSNVYVTHKKASGSSEGHVTVAVQGDGVHLLDLSSFHPVVSHTLGPAITFSCPAVSRSTVEDGQNICTTYAVIESSPDIKPEESGRTIWMWRENVSTGLNRASQKKNSAVVPHAVSRLFVSEGLQSCVLLLSAQGEVTVVDAELNIQSTGNSPADGRVLLETFLFSRDSCSFLPTRLAPPQGAVITLLVATGNSLRMQVLALDQENSVVELGDCEAKVNPDEISSISCSASGFLSILTRDGSWHSFQLESTNGTSMGVSRVSEALHLTSLSFVSSSPPPLPQQCRDEVSLLSLGSSHVLLAAVTVGPSPKLVLLLWDLQYSVLLTSHSLAIPATLSYSKDSSVRVNLVATSGSPTLLLLTPTAYSGSQSSTRSSILVVPYTVPTTSTIAGAMGRASAGMKWLAQNTSFNPHSSELDSPREKLLAKMCSAMEQNRPVEASTTFFTWNNRETAKLVKEGEALLSKGESRLDPHPDLSYTFVKQLLDVILQPSKPANMPYSSRVLHHLLERGVVSGNMVEGGLLSILRLRNGWESMELALKNVQDVSEADVMQVLKAVVTHHRDSEADANAMQIDSVPTDIPPLPNFLLLCVSYKMSPRAMQLAMRQHLRDAADIVCVLEVLENWLSVWGTKDVPLLPDENNVKKLGGVYVLMPSEDKESDLPSLEKILSFLQIVLDASFLTLLQHRPSHRILLKMRAHFESELASIDSIEPLRGPLEPFAKAQVRAIKAASEGGRREPLVDWRRRKRQAQEQTGLAVGLYRLEELVL